MEAAACRYLSRREYSRCELRYKLLAQGYPEALVDRVLTDLARAGWQSDARFAAALVRKRVSKGFGVHRIRNELKQRGIESDDTLRSEELDWDELVEKTYIKKFGHTLPDQLPALAARERFLLGRGFERDRIRRLFRRLRRGD
ncbi:regulatory protein RecX [Candidatus Methylocalor cossyra]|uniref:Regulatory protein RecX n=1 Tax=Candidatus Methylocalor cossyra TaxID=3108543 RepID=A0ABP1C9G2_9GAMM